MATTTQMDPHPLESAQDIERELVNLWRDMSSADKPIGRARVLSLITVTEEQRESEMAEVLGQLANRHPARNLLLLLGDSEAPELFDAAVSLLCDIRGGSLCAEQILVHVRGSARERLPGAVRTLLSADLPVVMWWTLVPGAERELYDRLARQVERVIIDSATLEHPAGLRDLSLHGNGQNITDLNWSRLTPWRETIAQFFDPIGQDAYLARLNEVTIRTGGCMVGGWLLAGWLASRLGWTLEPGEGNTLQWSGAGLENGTLHIEALEGDHTIEGVTMRASGASFEVHRVQDGSIESSVQMAGGSPLQQIVHLDDEHDAALLSRELDLLMRDYTYEEAVAALQPVLEGLP